jgi:serine/threonine protein kinase
MLSVAWCSVELTGNQLLPREAGRSPSMLVILFRGSIEPDSRQDLDRDNILTNCVAGPCQARGQREGDVSPFRSLFPVRYYINDFEFAVTFDADSEPSSRVVSGLPITGIRTGQYGRDPAPEMLSGSPYCPFRADIWQLGTMFMSCFDVSGHSALLVDLTKRSIYQQLGHFSEPLIALFKTMRSEDPSVRPSAASALERVRQISRELPYHTLSSAVPKKPVSPPPSP